MEIMAQYDFLIERTTDWLEVDSPIETIREVKSLLTRATDKVKTIKSRLDSPLIVATFGGSGAGKSSLVNVLVGQNVSKVGRERPTTKKPICVLHAEMNIAQLPFTAEQCEIHQVRTPLFRDIILIDCPDPNTSDAATPGSNLEMLRKILPVCDVLIYVSTQQQYRSARVTDELSAMGTGCRLVFVQTHADIDTDIREDWKKLLAPHYSVPEMFFIDTKKAEQELQQGTAFSGEFGRLQLYLLNQLASAQRGLIRRANGLDILEISLKKSASTLSKKKPTFEELEAEILKQQEIITREMTDKLKASLSENKHLWEKRLLGEVGVKWGSSPFAMALRIYHGLGNILASAWLFRARSSAQVALIGAIQGARWLSSKSEEQTADERLLHLDNEMVDEALLRQSWLVLTGYLHKAGFPHRWIDAQTLNELRIESSHLSRSFMSSSIQKIDVMIEELARSKSGLGQRIIYESLFCCYLLFVIYRIGKNFFIVSFMDEAKILTIDFYIPSLIFFLIWTAFLLIMFSRQLGQGVEQKIAELAKQLVAEKLTTHLFPKVEREINHYLAAEQDILSLKESVYQLQRMLQQGTNLGGRLDISST
jgi:hypothetical protein